MKIGLLLLAALAAACAHRRAGPSARVVVGEGWAAEDRARPGTAARRATADALRRAVESAAGVSLTARTRVRDGAAVSERVVADAAGCVLRYEVLSSRRRNGGIDAVVRASVAADAGACAGRAPLPPAALEEGEVSVELTGASAAEAAAAGVAASALRGRLAARGWRVLERGGACRLTGTVRVGRVDDPRLGTLSSARVELSLRATSAGGRRVLGESSTESAAVDPDPAAAVRRAAAAAAERSFSGASSALEAALWDEETTN